MMYTTRRTSMKTKQACWFSALMVLQGIALLSIPRPVPPPDAKEESILKDEAATIKIQLKGDEAAKRTNI